MKNLKKSNTSDIIASFLKEKKVKHVFGIIGSANAHIFDSIRKLNYTKIVCVHHEQAATMAIQTYFRVTGKISAALVTAGGATANAITGVISGWADSMPGLIIAGQENSKFMKIHKNMRMWGIQGFDSVDMVKKVADKLPMKDFKKRYGKDAENVKFGTATNIVKKKLNIDEYEGARNLVNKLLNKEKD